MNPSQETNSTDTHRPKQTLQFIRQAFLIGLLTSSSIVANAADVSWTGTNGNWSDATNWSSNPALPGSGDTVNFDLGAGSGITSTIDTTPWSVQGINFTSSANSLMLAGPSTTLTIGSGGISVTAANTGGGQRLNLGGIWWWYPPANLGTLNVTSNQTWATNGAGNNNGYIGISANLTGNAVITVNNASPNDQAGILQFVGGTSSGFTGSFVLESGLIRLHGPGTVGGSASTSQLDRLGSNALVFRNTNSGAETYNALELWGMSGTNAQSVFNTPIVFETTGTKERRLNIFGDVVSTNSTTEIAGQWSGALDNVSGEAGLKIQSAPLFTTNGYQADELLIRFTGDNQSLTSNKTGGDGMRSSAIWINSGTVSLENANAWGTGNSLSVGLGSEGVGATGNYYSGLFAKNGIDVSSTIFIGAGGVANVAIAELGIQETGSVTFSGNIVTNRGGVANRPSNLYLSAASGAAVTFSGDFSELPAFDPDSAPVLVKGGGTVILSGDHSARAGQTIVTGGSTLRANGVISATGTGAVFVGFGAASTTGDLTANSKSISVASTADFVVGQSLSGTGIAAGSVVTHIGSGFILMSEVATSAGTGVAVTGGTSTGILGGSGQIRPGGINGVIVASGSSVAPGNSIGTLIVDGGNTSGALLTMESGAAFTFELSGNGGTPDQVDFWNYAGATDFALNTNAINLMLDGTEIGGSYTVSLFRFFSDSGTTTMASGITSGLSVGTLDANISVASLNYNAGGNTIDLNYTVIPEPGTWALLGLGLAVTLAIRKRRR